MSHSSSCKRRLPRLRIRSKLGLLVAIPLLALLCALCVVTSDYVGEAARLARVKSLSELAMRAGAVVHEVQRERGASAGLIGSRGAQFGPVLETSRKRTDVAVEALHAFLADRVDASADVRGPVDRVRGDLDRLPAIRAAVTRGEISATDAIAYYTELDAHLLELCSRAVSETSDQEVGRRLHAYVSFLHAKEFAGIQRALLSHALAAHSFPRGGFRRFAAAAADEATFTKSFEDAATAGQLGRYEQELSSAAVDEAEAIRARVLENGSVEGVDVQPARWFEVQTEKIDRMRNVELSLSLSVRAVADEHHATARRSVLASTAFALVIIIAALASTIAIGGAIARSIAELSRAASLVSNGESEVRVDIRSGDELESLGAVFNRMVHDLDASRRRLSEMNRTLEQAVEARTAELRREKGDMRLVLDNVKDGLMTVALDGTISAGHAACLEHWFGDIPPGTKLWNLVARHDAAASQWLALGWSGLREDFLPMALVIDQLPKRVGVGTTKLELRYEPIYDAAGAQIERVLVVVADVTARIAMEKDRERQQELLATFEHLMADRAGTLDFIAEIAELVRRVAGHAEKDKCELARWIHTIKGGCATFAVGSIATLCHEIEQRTEENGVLSDGDRAALACEWGELAERIAPLVASHAKSTDVVIDQKEYQDALAVVQEGRSHGELLGMMSRWTAERAAPRLEWLAEQARRIARRLGKRVVTGVEARASRIAADGRDLRGLWLVLVHFVRNAIDHGIEPANERAGRGKPEAGQLTFQTYEDATGVHIRIHDDGGGIAWETLAERALAKGLRLASREEILEALFSGGLSSKTDATETSGRGVGMSAVWTTLQDIGARLEISSESGRGTTATVTLGRDRGHPRSAPRLAAA